MQIIVAKPAGKVEKFAMAQLAMCHQLHNALHTQHNPPAHAYTQCDAGKLALQRLF